MFYAYAVFTYKYFNTMKKIILLLALLTSIVAYSQENHFIIEQIKVYSQPTDSTYSLVSDWEDFSGQLVVTDSMMHMGTIDVSLDDLTEWVHYLPKIAPIVKEDSSLTTKTSVWYLKETDIQCLFEFTFYNSGEIILEHHIAGFIMLYKIKETS